MILPYSDAMQFIEGYKSVLFEVLLRAGDKQGKDLLADLAKARRHAAKDATAIANAIAALSARGERLDDAVALAIKSLRVGRWVHLRNTTKYALLFDAKVENAYAVKALTNPLHEVTGMKAFIFEAGLIEYRGQYVCDGLVGQPVQLGPGIRADLKESYARIKQAGRFHARPEIFVGM